MMLLVIVIFRLCFLVFLRVFFVLGRMRLLIFRVVFVVVFFIILMFMLRIFVSIFWFFLSVFFGLFLFLVFIFFIFVFVSIMVFIMLMMQVFMMFESFVEKVLSILFILRSVFQMLNEISFMDIIIWRWERELKIQCLVKVRKCRFFMRFVFLSMFLMCLWWECIMKSLQNFLRLFQCLQVERVRYMIFFGLSFF